MESPIGRLGSPSRPAASSRSPAATCRTVARRPSIRRPWRPPIAELEAYFAGRLREFSHAPRPARAGAFDAAVWTATRQIPYGETASYGELALMAGYPGAARAAGGSMSRCPLFPVVPCHRVIHADGSIRGWGGDLWIKRWLLDLECRQVRPATTGPNAIGRRVHFEVAQSRRWRSRPKAPRRRMRSPSRATSDRRSR